MDGGWSAVAQRAADALGVAPGELVLVRDRAGRPEVLSEVLLAVERRGATPLPELLAPDDLGRLLRTVPVPHLAAWDRHRLGWVGRADRVLVLEGAGFDPAGVPEDALAAWAAAVDRLRAVDEARRLPFLVAAVPTAARAAALGLSLPELDAALAPALAADRAELRREIAPVRAAVVGAGTLTVRSGAGCELSLRRGDRAWLEDDGSVAADAAARGVQPVVNLPAGSLYTTVLEGETRGRLRLAGDADGGGSTLRFEGGRVVDVDGGAGAEQLRALFARHSGGADRVSHVGVGLNPRLRRPFAWALVDEHVHGALFVAFGENRYLGGENASSLNVDFALADASLLADDRVVVDRGAIAV